MRGFMMQRLCMLTEPEPGNPQEIEGVLNPTVIVKGRIRVDVDARGGGYRCSGYDVSRTPVKSACTHPSRFLKGHKNKALQVILAAPGGGVSPFDQMWSLFCTGSNSKL